MQDHCCNIVRHTLTHIYINGITLQWLDWLPLSNQIMGGFNFLLLSRVYRNTFVIKGEEIICS